MNTEQRQLLYDALMEGVPIEEPRILLEMADVVTNDLDRIEPLIDAMLEAARAGSNPTDWKAADAAFEFFHLGTTGKMTVQITVGQRLFRVEIERARMKTLGEALIRESGL